MSVCAQADAKRLISRLQHIVFSHQLWNVPEEYCMRPITRPDKPPLVKVHLVCEDMTDMPRRLSVLRAIRIQTPHPVHLKITQLKMDSSVAVSALQGLPAWSCCLVFER